MRLLRLVIYVIIVLAIAKFTSGNRPSIQEETTYTNTFSFRAAPQVEEQSLRDVMKNDSVIFTNFYSNLPLNHMPMLLKPNQEASSMISRIYQPNGPQHRKPDTNLSFIVF